jgi:hypothetical protein
MKATTMSKVAKLITETPCRQGVTNKQLARVNTLSSMRRVRELAQKFERTSTGPAYEIVGKVFYPKGNFKKFCRNY